MKNIVNGALLMCTGGTVPTPLTVTSQFIMKSDGNLVATKLDSSPFVNIKPFGICSPQSGKYPHPCNLCLVGTWLGANETVLVNGAAALLQGSKIPCAFGMISIIQPGQFTMMMGQVIPPISLNPIRIETIDISLDINQEENESSEGTTENTNANENNNSTEVDNNGEINEENESNEVYENRTYKAHLKVEYEDRLKPVNMSYKVYDSGDNLIREGVLDDNGEAFLEGLLSENIKVEYGEDERDEPIEDELALSPIFEYRGKVDKNYYGTYKFYGPSNKLGHMVYDVLPYWLWGTFSEDNKTFPERIHGIINEYVGYTEELKEVKDFYNISIHIELALKLIFEPITQGIDDMIQEIKGSFEDMQNSLEGAKYNFMREGQKMIDYYIYKGVIK